MKDLRLTDDRVTPGLWKYLIEQHEFVARLDYQFCVSNDEGTSISILSPADELLFIFHLPEPLVEMLNEDELDALSDHGFWVTDSDSCDYGSRIGFASERIAMRKKLITIFL
jgi:hypothetical protein